MTLSEPQLLALAHLASHRSPATCLPGGIWTAEPDAWDAGRRDAVSDYWIRVETLEALERRRLVRKVVQVDGVVRYELTRAGETQVVIHGHNLAEV